MNPISIGVIKPSGVFDGVNSMPFRQEVETLIRKGVLSILVNLEQTHFLDSSGLGALVAALKTVRSAGGDLYLCCLNKQVQMIFELTSMDQAFKIYEDPVSFERSFPGSLTIESIE